MGFASWPICCVLGLALEVVAESGNVTARSAPACVLSLTGAPGKKGAEGQGGLEKCPDLSYFKVMVLTTKIRCLCFNEILLDEKVRDINDTTMLLD